MQRKAAKHRIFEDWEEAAASMTYPTAAKLWYSSLVATFFGFGATLLYFDHFELVVLWPPLLVALVFFVNRRILVCPNCGEYPGRFRFGGYEPWLGPKCRYCDSDLKQAQVTLRTLRQPKSRP